MKELIISNIFKPEETWQKLKVQDLLFSEQDDTAWIKLIYWKLFLIFNGCLSWENGEKTAMAPYVWNGYDISITLGNNFINIPSLEKM